MIKKKLDSKELIKCLTLYAVFLMYFFMYVFFLSTKLINLFNKHAICGHTCTGRHVSVEKIWAETSESRCPAHICFGPK